MKSCRIMGVIIGNIAILIGFLGCDSADIDVSAGGMYMADLQRTSNYEADVQLNSDKAKWIFQVPEKKFKYCTQPVIAGPNISFGNSDHYLYCIDKQTGNQVWKYKTDSVIASSPAIKDGFIYFGGFDGYIYSLNYSNGDLVWKYKTDGAIYSSPAVYKNTLYIGCKDSSLYAIDVVHGKLKWRYETGGEVNSSPCIMGSTVYFGSKDGYLYALDLEDGNPIWKFKTDTPIEITPSIVNTTIIFAGFEFDNYGRNESTSIFALDINSGREIWRFKTDHMIIEHSGTIALNKYIFGSTHGKQLILALDINTGKKIWSRIGSIDLDLISSSNIVYCISYDYGLEALDVATGDVVFRVKTAFDGLAIDQNTIYGNTIHGLLALSNNGTIEWLESKPETETAAKPVVIKTVADLGPPPQVSIKPPKAAKPKVNTKEVAEQIETADLTEPKAKDKSGLIAAENTKATEETAIKVDENEYLPKPDEFVPVEIPAEMIHEEPPEYPRLAKQAGIEAIVWIKVLVDKNGNVRDAMVLKSSGSKAGFDEAALEAAYKSKFKPGIQNGQPVAIWLSYKVEFRLSDK